MALPVVTDIAEKNFMSLHIIKYRPSS